jgi:uncharacterized protein YegP (UPF0339 family)
MPQSADRFVIFWDVSQGRTRYRWRLRNPTNGYGFPSKLAYEDKSTCLKALHSMQKQYPDIPIVDLTIPRDEWPEA